LLLCLTILFAACATDYYTYSGSQIYQGQGGASKRINGVDLWIVGTPPRDYVANCGQQIAKGPARGAARTLASQRLINAGLGIRLCLEFVRDYWNYRKLPRLNS
jgi:hypothetical protein